MRAIVLEQYVVVPADTVTPSRRLWLAPLFALFCGTTAALAEASRDFVVPAASPAVAPALATVLAAVSAERIHAHMAWLSDPAREGRGLGTTGLEATKAYLTRELAVLGIEPLGDDPAARGGAAFLQRVPLRIGRALAGDGNPSDRNWYAALNPRRAAGPRPHGVARSLVARSERRADANVVAIHRGRSSDSAVVIGAHMDHLGKPGGVLHPGADDNASGVAALLEIARAVASLPEPLALSVVFVFWTGEELGHFGSSHYVREPRWPLARTAVYINLDMIAHPWRPEELAALGAPLGRAAGDEFLARVTPSHFAEPGIDHGSPWLADLLAQAGHSTGMALHLDRTDGTDGGSDYRAFARAGLPWVRFFGNFFPAYHQPGDVLADIDAGQVARMARLALATVWLAAEKGPASAASDAVATVQPPAARSNTSDESATVP